MLLSGLLIKFYKKRYYNLRIDGQVIAAIKYAVKTLSINTL